MSVRFLALLVLSSFAATVSAHGFIQEVIPNLSSFPGFLPDYDNWQKPDPLKITRHVPDDGPVLDFTSTNLTCNVAAEDSKWRTTSHAPVNAGDEVTFAWNRWPLDHRGPITTYMAYCGGSCTEFDGTSGKVWFKIDEMGLVSGTTDSGSWGSLVLIANNLTWTVTIPASLKPGAYLIRQEILALHSAGAPQFYPSCSQLLVSSKGTSFPSSDELVAIPGIYSKDTSTTIDIWTNGQTSYPIAGPPVTKLAAFTSDPNNSKPGGRNVSGATPGKVVTLQAGQSVGSSSTSSNSNSGSNSGNSTTTLGGSSPVTSPSSVASSAASVVSNAAKVTATSKSCSVKKNKRAGTNSSRKMSKRYISRKRRL